MWLHNCLMMHLVDYLYIFGVLGSCGSTDRRKVNLFKGGICSQSNHIWGFFPLHFVFGFLAWYDEMMWLDVTSVQSDHDPVTRKKTQQLCQVEHWLFVEKQGISVSQVAGRGWIFAEIQWNRAVKYCMNMASENFLNWVSWWFAHQSSFQHGCRSKPALHKKNCAAVASPSCKSDL